MRNSTPVVSHCVSPLSSTRSRAVPGRRRRPRVNAVRRLPATRSQGGTWSNDPRCRCRVRDRCKRRPARSQHENAVWVGRSIASADVRSAHHELPFPDVGAPVRSPSTSPVNIGLTSRVGLVWSAAAGRSVRRRGRTRWCCRSGLSRGLAGRGARSKSRSASQTPTMRNEKEVTRLALPARSSARTRSACRPNARPSLGRSIRAQGRSREPSKAQRKRSFPRGVRRSVAPKVKTGRSIDSCLGPRRWAESGRRSRSHAATRRCREPRRGQHQRQPEGHGAGSQIHRMPLLHPLLVRRRTSVDSVGDGYRLWRRGSCETGTSRGLRSWSVPSPQRHTISSVAFDGGTSGSGVQRSGLALNDDDEAVHAGPGWGPRDASPGDRLRGVRAPRVR